MWTRRLRWAALTIAAYAALAAAGCQRGGALEHPQRNVPVAPIADIIARRAPELMKIPGVVGVYEGRTGNDTPCIRIMIAKRSPELERRLPREIEGVPAEIEVTGVIRPM